MPTRLPPTQCLKTVGNRLADPVFVVLLAVLFAGMTVALVARIGPDRFYNSDAVQPFLMVRDAIRDPGILWQWYHPPNLFVFPDWLYALLLDLLRVPLTHQPLVYPGLVLAGYCVASAWALAGARLVDLRIGLLSTAAILLIVFAVVAGFVPLHAKRYYPLLLPPFWHTGAIFSGLLLYAGMVRLAFARTSSPLLWLALALAFVSGVSDQVFLLWFALPLVVAAGLQSLSVRGWRTLGCAAAVLAATVSGSLVYQLRPDHLPSCGGVPQSLTIWKRALFAAWRQVDLLDLALVGLLALMGIRGLVLVYRCVRGLPLTPATFLELMLIGSTYAAAIVPTAMGCIVVPELLRYSTPVFLLPFLWATVRLFGKVSPAGRRWGAAGLGLAALAAWAMLLPATRFDIARQVKSPLSVCLNRGGPQAGLGDYWTAKRVMLETDLRVHIVQLLRDGQPHRFNFDARWFRGRADDGSAFRPDFIVLTRLDPASMKRRFGAPDRIERCSGQVIWHYGRPLTGFDG